MRRRLLVALLSGFILCASAAPAEAKFFEIWGSGLVGGGWGKGNGATDFYRWASGGAGGFEVGAKILFISAFVDYLRWFGGEEGANLITFNLGGDYALELGKTFAIVFRLAFGYYHGTLPTDATIMLDNVEVNQVNTRGIGVHGGLGPRITFLKFFSVGVTPEIGYHYFFGGAGKPITSTDQNSSGFDLNVLAYFRVGFGI
jgi:hypothetical protein